MTDLSPDRTTDQYGHSSEAERMMQYDANKKSVLIAYLLWFFLGAFAVHRFYLGATKSALVMLGMWVIFGALSGITFGIFGVLLIIPAVWLFIDLFLIPGIARDKNNELIMMLSR